jgi:cytochrome c-type protein NapB
MSRLVRSLLLVALASSLGLAAPVAMSQSAGPDGGLSLPLRGPTPVADPAPAPRIPPIRNTAARETRNYPEQPPVIPHTIEGYQIDLNGNKCLSCHARSRIRESQAPMISITHFMDREGQFLATVSPRRFFCTECHVSQTDAKPPVANTFIDIDSLITHLKAGGSAK